MVHGRAIATMRGSPGLLDEVAVRMCQKSGEGETYTEDPMMSGMKKAAMARLMMNLRACIRKGLI